MKKDKKKKTEEKYVAPTVISEGVFESSGAGCNMKQGDCDPVWSGTS